LIYVDLLWEAAARKLAAVLNENQKSIYNVNTIEMRIRFKHISGLLIVFFTALSFLACSKENIENNGDTIGNDDDNGNSISANQQPTGTSANDLLSDENFTSMVIEIAYVEGFAPTQNAINNLATFLENRTHKPNGITITTKEITPSGNTTYTIQDVINIENANRTKYNNSNQIAVWILFIDGESASNTNNGVVLGTAYRNTSFVIFEETIQSLTDGTFEPDRDIVETTVITHEFGHILGLTNLGTPMQTQHEDTEHSKHCNNNDCLMYWSAETDSGLENLIGSSSSPQLDSQCIADLQANGGK